MTTVFIAREITSSKTATISKYLLFEVLMLLNKLRVSSALKLFKTKVIIFMEETLGDISKANFYHHKCAIACDSEIVKANVRF